MSWEEVECLGGCANAPLVQIGSDYFEDLDKDSFEKLIYDIEKDNSPVPRIENREIFFRACKHDKKIQ